MKAVILVAALGALFLPAESNAFIFIRGGIFQKGERPVARAPVWANRTLRFHLNPDQTAYAGSLTPELSAAQFQTAVSEAVNAWASVCGSDLRVELVGTGSSLQNSGDAFNTIVWDNRTTAEGNVVGNTNTLAVAFSSTVNATDTQVGCDIVVNGEAVGNFAIDGNGSDYDLIGILVHEIGHCLGLDHSVEPPTFTSANPVLLGASMKATVAAGDTTLRTISQDEVDGMECVNPTLGSARNGKNCGSYHGSNGAGALSGTVPGGPAATVACAQGSSVTGLSSSGGGCISSAIASGGGGGNAPPAWGGWLLPLFLVLSAQFLVRFGKRFFLTLAPLLLAPTAEANVDLFYSYSQTKPALMNSAIRLSTNEGTFARTEEQTISHASDLGGAVFLGRQATQWGVFYRSALAQIYTQKGFSALGGQTLAKESRLQGWATGLAGRFLLKPASNQHTNFYFLFLLGIGSFELAQKIRESGGESALVSDARAVELTAQLGALIPLWGRLRLNLSAGYTRLQTNAFSVKSATGARYAAFKPDQRLAVDGGQELRLKRNGVSAMAGFDLLF